MTQSNTQVWSIRGDTMKSRRSCYTCRDMILFYSSGTVLLKENIAVRNVFDSRQHFLKAKFHYTILVADRSQADRRHVRA